MPRTTNPTAVAGGGSANPQFNSSTFANLPSAASSAGLIYRVSNANNSLWISNGTKWLPLGGSYLHYSLQGSVASPIATLSSVTLGQFSLTGGDPAIAANILTATSRLRVDAYARKRNANATATFAVRIGTADAVGDSALASPGIVITDGGCVRVFSDAIFSSTTVFVAASSMVANASAAATTVSDRNTNVDTTAAMSVSFHISAGNASDLYDLISVAVQIWP